jgi:hypothetical protein
MRSQIPTVLPAPPLKQECASYSWSTIPQERKKSDGKIYLVPSKASSRQIGQINGDKGAAFPHPPELHYSILAVRASQRASVPPRPEGREALVRDLP